MITARLAGQAAFAARLAALPETLASRLAREIERLSGELHRRVERNLSGAVLQRRSGRLAAGIDVSVARVGVNVSATVRTAVPYAAIHEYGGTLPARRVLPRNGRVLAFPWRGQPRFYTHVEVPAARMPERSFLRSALAEMEPEIRAALTAAALDAASTVAPT
jgi:phage gpG-like protein